MQEPIVKRLFQFSGALSVLALLGMTSYRVRELIAGLVLLSLGFAVLFLIILTLVLVQEGAARLRIRVPQWNQAGRDWMFEFAHAVQGRHLWQRWTHRVPAPSVRHTEAD